MKSRRSNQRQSKSFYSDGRHDRDSRKPNKHTVFSSAPDPDYEALARKNRNRKSYTNYAQIPSMPSNSDVASTQATEISKQFLTIKGFTRQHKLWSLLEIRGPYRIFFMFGFNAIKNRPLCSLMRKILDKVYLNALKYREEDIPKILQFFDRSKNSELEDAIAVAEEMCGKVFRFFDDQGEWIDLYEDNMVSAIKNLFHAEEIKVRYHTQLDIRRLKIIFTSNNVGVFSEELEEIRNSLVHYCFHLSIDLLKIIFHIDVYKFPGKVFPNFKSIKFMNSSEYYRNSRSCTRFKTFSPTLLDRNRAHVSLWVSIPCEEDEHLLEFVMDYGLIKLLPVSAKSFLDQWIFEVRKKMRSRLKKGDFRRKTEILMSDTDHDMNISSDDVRIKAIITGVLDNILNSKKFRVFDCQWKDFTMNLIENIHERWFDNNSVLETVEDVHKNMDPESLDRFSALFPKTPTDRGLLSHALHQLLQFVVVFAMYTMRHIFHVNRNTREIKFDGQMDKEVTDFSNYSQNAAPQRTMAEPSTIETAPASSSLLKSPWNKQVIKPRKTLLPTPTINIPSGAITSEGFDSRVAVPPNHSLLNQQNTFVSNNPSMLDSSFPYEEHPEIDDKKTFIKFSTTPLIEPSAKRSKTETQNNSFSSEVTEEDLSNARALRAPSVVSSFQLEDFEGVPEDWIFVYKSALDMNQKLLAELERAKTRLDAVL